MKKGFLKLTGLLMAAVLMTTTAYAQETKADYSLTIDGEQMQADIYKEDNTLFIPLRAICEKLEFNVEWVNETRTVILEKLPVYITFSVDEDGYTFAKTAPMSLGHAPKIINDRTYVPSNFIDEILKGQIEISENSIDIKWAVEPEKTEKDYTNVTFIKIDETGKLLVNNFLRGDMLLNITDETVITNEDGEALKVEDITTENELKVKLSNAMTMSLPPQINAYEIIVTKNLAPVTKSGVVSEVVENEGKITQLVIGTPDDSENFFAVNVSDEIDVYDINGEKLSLSDIKEGSEISASLSAFSTKSIPPQFVGYAIRVTK